MLLKLVMPQVNRMIHAGAVCRWHKAEGERVDYGEDVCDVRVDIERRRLAHPLSDIIGLLTGSSRLTATELQREAPGQTPFFIVRLTASDAGILRRICAPEGTGAPVGGLLALLTTDLDEAPDLGDEALRRAGAFRVVANAV